MNAIINQQTNGGAVSLAPSLFDSFIAYLDASPKSIATYTAVIKQFGAWVQQNGITAPTREDLIKWRDGMKAAGKSAATIQLYITVARLFFRWTDQNGIYPNIADHLKGAKVSRDHKKDDLSGEQARDVLSTAQAKTGDGTESAKRDYALIALMLATGARTVEMVRANIGDIRTRGGETVIYVQGKGRDDRNDWEPVPAAVERAIRDYLKTRGTRDPAAPLFASVARRDKGQRMTTRSISRIVKGQLKRVGFDSPRLTAHSMRHTAVTLAKKHISDITKVKEFARHQSIATTLIYDHELTAGAAKDECSRAVALELFGD